ncbi:MAG: short-chain dehydrogenase [Ignavibacteriae bacterium]|nr:short-chain dehydrogenase [Ignavibacteriota bacterium]
MDIKNRTVLVLGGWGLVGSAICRKLMGEHPKRIIVTSLKKEEAEEGVAQLYEEFPSAKKNFFVPWWGNIFTRHDFKDMNREDILGDDRKRKMLIDDMLEELDENVLHRSAIFQLLEKYKPDIIIDSINSATAIAYQDIFQSARGVLKEFKQNNGGTDISTIQNSVERLLCTLYVPQLIRHVQILYKSMHKCGTKTYVKIGTSGTGGMGLNIPYTHSEERPSSVLLSKSAVAGAHTLLLFLMGRTPDAPITKEIKPAAAIAWKKVGYGEIKRRGKPVELVDCPPKQGVKLRDTFRLRMKNTATPMNETLKSVFIDTGENGIFSRGEFEAITTPGQMEFVTPEEIAENVIYEIKGRNTGHDVIDALDNTIMNPTYRAGYMYHSAFEKISELEKLHEVDSVAFEVLGPPRLSKLLYESYLLKRCFKDIRSALKATPRQISDRLTKEISSNKKLRAQIISIGIPILLPDGKTLLRGDEIKIPPFQGENELRVNAERINHWAHDGWVDLRVANMKLWKERFEQLIEVSERIPANETSSRYMYTPDFWNNFKEIHPGKLAGWIFSYEEEGMRMKA